MIMELVQITVLINDINEITLRKINNSIILEIYPKNKNKIKLDIIGERANELYNVLVKTFTGLLWLNKNPIIK